MVNYAVSDMLTRIRNGIRVKKTKVSVISTNLTRSIASILKREGFIEDFVLSNKNASGNQAPATLDIYLKWSNKTAGGSEVRRRTVLTNVKCVSRPGVRMYANANNIPQVLGGLGITILSTSKGILTDYEARTQKVGGEVLCMLW